MAKKEKRVRRGDSYWRWYLKQHRRGLRRLGVVTGLVAVAVLLFFLLDPLAGPPKAIDANGEEVRTGVLDTQGGSARTGSVAPNFVLPDYDQKAVYLDQFKGKVVLINFWASWCTFCEEEMPDIMRIAKQFPEEVVVLAVNRGESRGTAKGWSDRHEFPDLANVHWLLDAREDVVDEYRVDGMPQSFFIDSGGNVGQELRRVMEYDEMLAAVEALVPAEDRARR
jgi:thiol-disulfide isomerase/thioredoxin